MNTDGGQSVAGWFVMKSEEIGLGLVVYFLSRLSHASAIDDRES